jgi:beta-N-acetylhexosaminidase
VKITPSATKDLLDSLARVADSAAVVIIAPHVRRVEGEGRPTIPAHIAAWIDTVAQRRPTVVAAFGNPYVIRQFPSVGTYLVTYGVGDDLERAAAAALFGTQPITGRTPVSLPGFFAIGDGIQRP